MQQSNPHIKIIKNGRIVGNVYGDEMRIEQVIINFITNAIKYGPDGKEIIINSNLIGDEVYFSVKDFGIGMCAEHQQKIFEKFYRIEETSERFQGLGIGLYICQEIIEDSLHRRIFFCSNGKEWFQIPISSCSNRFNHGINYHLIILFLQIFFFQYILLLI